jgi:hypothetical protein
MEWSMFNEVKKLETEDEARFWHNSLREQITQENNLLDQRLTWLIQGQGLLFAALAFAWGETTLVIFLLLERIS